MMRRMLGRAGLNVTTNGILLDSFFIDISRALLRGIWRTFSISSFLYVCLVNQSHLNLSLAPF